MDHSTVLPEGASDRDLPCEGNAQPELAEERKGWSWLDSASNTLAVAEKCVNRMLLEESERILRQHAGLRLPDGRLRVVRAGMRPARRFQTACGALTLRVPRLRDRGGVEAARLKSNIAPSCGRVAKEARQEADKLYASGLSLAGLARHYGKGSGGGAAAGMSRSSLSRHRAEADAARFDAWSGEGMGGPVAIMFADATYVSVRDLDRKACVMSSLGVDGEGRKSVLWLRLARSESAAEWEAFIADLQAKGMGQAPRLIVGDGGEGLWAAARKLLPGSAQQICWIHATRDGARLLPRKLQGEYGAMAKAIYDSPGKAEAVASFLRLEKRFGGEHPGAVATIGSRLDRLLTFFDFPREIWKSIYTSNPIESSFSKVKERLRRARGMHTSRTILPMMLTLFEMGSKNFSTISDNGHLALLLKGALYNDGKLIKVP
jgi:transposase-like protein